ncbi:MAG: pyrroline-5-carboxylate reductase [Chlorobiaceae bacterium]
MTNLQLGFIGTGRIARALIASLSGKTNIVISGYDREPAVMAAISADYHIAPCTSIKELALTSQVIILAVKPYQIAEVLGELTSSLRGDHVLISVAAGISSEFIRAHSLDTLKVVRVMPNTPAFVGEGMTAISRGRMASDEDVTLACDIFSSVGRVVVLDESKMDAVTAVSGSGPAYMFHILDALAAGGVQCGLSADEALLLSAQTMLGAAKMVLAGQKNPEELKNEVTTPGGTTEAGLKVMNEKNIKQIVMESIAAAALRSKELMK